MKMQMKYQQRKVLVSSICVLATSVHLAFGHGFRNPPPSPTTLALNGGKSVLVTDVSGQAVNPALLSEVDHPAASASVTILLPETSFTSASGDRVTTRNKQKVLPNLFAAYPINSSLVLGLSVTTPYGQSVEWPRKSEFPYLSELRLAAMSPAMAIKLSDCFTVGAALDVYVAEFETRQGIPWPALTGIPTLPMGSARLEGDDSSVGATVGMKISLGSAQRASLVYRSPFTLAFKGEASLSNVPPMLPPSLSDKAAFRTEIEFPTVITAGYAFDVTDRLTLAAEVEWIEFSRFKELPVQVGTLAASGLFPSVIPQQWKDVWTCGAAARWKCTDTLNLNFSYRFLESPIPDSTLSPALPDADKHDVGAGFNWDTGRISISAAYTYSILENRNIKAAVNPAYPGRYDLDAHMVSASIGVTL